ncbi:MAG: hypothetical protein BGO86_15650 [Chryseobacterium sp. 36-9]|nr:MAG: hypothetical protein BGO86_15650 [Chryseobacterium sp. 36-9]
MVTDYKSATSGYHEGIHSMHAVSGFAINVYSEFVNAGDENASKLATNVSEYFAHSFVSMFTGTPLPTFANDNYYSGFNTWLNLKK